MAPLPGGLKTILASIPTFRNVGGLKEKQWAGEEEYVDLQVGRNCWPSVQRKMRTELWLSVLHRHRLGTTAAQSYPAMFAKGQKDLPEEVAFDIEKDVNRTFPEVAKFATGKGVQSLMNVLKAYAALDPEVGYCQGMNFLAGVLLMYLPSEADAYGALVVLMQHRRMRELYKEDLAWLQVRLWQVGRLMPSKLAAHLEERGCLPVLYMSSWLLTVFASAFPLSFASRVMDVLLTDSYSEPMMKVAIGIMKACETRLFEMREMEEMVEFMKNEVPNWEPSLLQDILTEALSAPWSPAQVEILEQTLGHETVLEAVKRNEAEVSQRALGGTVAAAAGPRCSADSAASTASAYSPPETPVVMTPLPPPPKWAARGSSQLGSLVALPQGRGVAAAPPPGPRPTIARRSVHGRTSSTRRDSGTARAMADLRGEFRRTSDGTSGPAGMSVLGAGRHLSADAVTAGQQRVGAAPVGSAGLRAATSVNTLQRASSTGSRGPDVASDSLQPRSNGSAPGGSRPPSAAQLRRALALAEDAHGQQDLLSGGGSWSAADLPAPPSSGTRRNTMSSLSPAAHRAASASATATGRAAPGGVPGQQRPASAGSGLARAGASGNFAGLVVGGRPSGNSLAGCSTGGLLRPSSAGQQRMGVASLPADLVGASSPLARGSSVGFQRQHNSSGLPSPQPATLVTQSMPAGVAELARTASGSTSGGVSLPSPTGSSELSPTDFAVLLASGTAGIRAIPTSGSASEAVSPARRPLDADAFSNGGDPAREQRLNHAAAAVRRVASGGLGGARAETLDDRSSGMRLPSNGSPAAAHAGSSRVGAARGREALGHMKSQMALFQEFGQLRPTSRGVQ